MAVSRSVTHRRMVTPSSKGAKARKPGKILDLRGTTITTILPRTELRTNNGVNAALEGWNTRVLRIAGGKEHAPSELGAFDRMLLDATRRGDGNRVRDIRSAMGHVLLTESLITHPPRPRYAR